MAPGEKSLVHFEKPYKVPHLTLVKSDQKSFSGKTGGEKIHTFPLRQIPSHEIISPIKYKENGQDYAPLGGHTTD